MNILFFDTETTGKADFKRAPDANGQPRLVQFGALLTDQDGNELSCASLIVTPQGFEIPQEVSDLHGITTEIARALGVDCSVPRHIFRRFWSAASLVVAHNIDFDLFIMDGEFYRALGTGKQWGEPNNTFCTMRAMIPVCKLPGYYGDYKFPKLEEAYKHAFGETFNAHNAMDDVRACSRLFFWMLKNGLTKLPNEIAQVPQGPLPSGPQTTPRTITAEPAVHPGAGAIQGHQQPCAPAGQQASLFGHPPQQGLEHPTPAP
jgi:DNA polymerase-3 subunit epsilon